MANFLKLFVSSILLHLHFYIVVIATDTAIQTDLYPFIRVYKNGTIERLVGTHNVPASVDPTTGIQSKDIIISPTTNVSARLYLPKNSNPRSKIPLLVYFHGGAFFTESAGDPLYQKYFNTLVAKANIVIISVNYRLAPENPLPTGYYDSWEALKWIYSHRGGHGTEPWLNRYAHFKRVCVGGDSAGANIAHNMVIRAGLEKHRRMAINGMLLTCPHFWGKEPIGNELDPNNSHLVSLMGRVWMHAYPNSTGLDDPLLNPSLNPNLRKLGCKRVLIIVAELDILRDRGIYYNKTLRSSGWKGDAKIFDIKGEEHAFNIRFPDTPNGIAMINEYAAFLNRRKI